MAMDTASRQVSYSPAYKRSSMEDQWKTSFHTTSLSQGCRSNKRAKQPRQSTAASLPRGVWIKNMMLGTLVYLC